MSNISNIYKIYYGNKIAGYLSNVSSIIPNITAQNTTLSITLYDFTATNIPDSYIYLTNAEYTENIYVLAFWFSVSENGLYTLLNILAPNYKLTVANKLLSDSFNTFNIPLTNVYNMCALIFEGNRLTKIVINDNIYPLVNSIPINNTNTINFALGNDNTMSSKLNGYIGEVQILNTNSFSNGKFNIDELYAKLKYKKIIPVTTQSQPETTGQAIPTTQSQPETIGQAIPSTQSQTETTGQAILTTQSQPETIQSETINPDINGINIIHAANPQTTVSTTTMYTPTTTNPPIQSNTGLLITV